MKTKIVRAWTDLSRKLIAFLATGVTATGVIYVLSLVGVTIDQGLASAIAIAVSALAGYLTTDVVKVPQELEPVPGSHVNVI